jgi:hypothetical protein
MPVVWAPLAPVTGLPYRPIPDVWWAIVMTPAPAWSSVWLPFGARPCSTSMFDVSG